MTTTMEGRYGVETGTIGQTGYTVHECESEQAARDLASKLATEGYFVGVALPGQLKAGTRYATVIRVD